MDTTRIPGWLEATKSTLRGSVQWADMLNETYRLVKKQMATNCVESFSDLSAEEQALFMAQIEELLSGEKVYGRFVTTLTEVMDQNIASAVDDRFARRENTQTKIQLIEEEASIGASALLQNLPKTKKSMLRILINSPFPGSYRWRAWKTILIDPVAKAEYEGKISKRRIDTISSLDTEITEKCQLILDTKFPQIVDSDKTQRNVLITMKTVLSYFHTIKSSSAEEQGEAFYLLMIPILIVYGEQDHNITALVEAYFAIQSVSRPRVLPNPSEDNQIESRKQFTKQFLARFKEIDGPLFQFFADIIKQKDPSISIDKEVVDIVAPYVEQVFIGLVEPEVFLFIWDQCLIIGFERLIPELCIAFLHILREELQLCQSLPSIRTVILCQSELVTVRRLQEFLATHTIQKVKSEMNIASTILFHEQIVINEIPALISSPNVATKTTAALAKNKQEGQDDDSDTDKPEDKKSEDATEAVEDNDNDKNTDKGEKFPDFEIEGQKFTWPKFYCEHDGLQDTIARIIVHPTNKQEKQMEHGKLRNKLEVQVVEKVATFSSQLKMRDRILKKPLDGKILIIRSIHAEKDKLQSAVEMELRRIDAFSEYESKVEELVRDLLVQQRIDDSIMKITFDFCEAFNYALFGTLQHQNEIKKSAAEELKIQQEMHEKAQKSVYKKVYSQQDIEGMNEKTRKAYMKKYDKYVKAYEKLQAEHVKRSKR